MSIEQPNQITVVTQNVLLDKTREKNGAIYSQDERIDAMAASFLNSGLSLDVVGIQEAYDNPETGQHNGERLATMCGFEMSHWQQHNNKPHKHSTVGRTGEYVGLFGSRVDHAEAIDLGDRRKGLLTSIAGVAFVTFHWRARVNSHARQSRRESATHLLDALGDYEDAVVFGDFNEPAMPLIAPARRALRNAGFESVFTVTGSSQPKTFPTPSYKGTTSESFGHWSLDDIMIRGNRIRALGAGTVAQVSMDVTDDQDIRPKYPSDHFGLWAQLKIAPKHD